MDLLRGNIKHTYFKYLGAAFGSAMLASVYSLVDMAMVGAVSGAGRRSGAGCGGAGVEHHLQLGFADRHWGFCTVQYAPGAGEAPAGQPGLYCGAGLYGDSGGGQLAGPNLL